MNAESILSTGIANIDTVYGGVRGTTLSSRHNLRHWQTIAESGIRTVIELRNEDHSERLCRLCKEYDIYYFPFPLDSHSVPDEVIASGLQELFDIIDKGDFYIGCAMGLHRTDMALSIIWNGFENTRSLQTPKQRCVKRFVPMVSMSVEEGLDIVEAIQNVETSIGDRPKTDVVMNVTVLE